MKLQNRIAIIGSGISGLTCAYLLDKHCQVTLFEANPYFGGHTNTVTVVHNDKHHAIDTGFIVFNKRTYPLFTKLMDKMQVGYQNSEMSFSFSSKEDQLEYSGQKLSTLFAQRRNFIRPHFYRLLTDILRFNRQAKGYLQNHFAEKLTLKAFVDANNYSRWFWRVYLLPMVASIWSCTPKMVEIMPAKFILSFFENHGMLQLSDPPQWLTISGGSHNYVKALLEDFQGVALNNSHVSKITRDLDGVIVHIGEQQLRFDQVIFACHSDTALALLAEPRDAEVNILGSIPYQTNEVILHTDAAVMPTRKAIWSSWNYHASSKELPTLTYYMNRLQNLQLPQDYFVTVNMQQSINPENIISRYNYAHPVLHQQAVEAQGQFAKVSGYENTFFCGAYWFNGFHEDGVASAVRVCEQLGVRF